MPGFTVKIDTWLNHEPTIGHNKYRNKLLCSINFNNDLSKIQIKQITLFNKTTNQQHSVYLNINDRFECSMNYEFNQIVIRNGPKWKNNQIIYANFVGTYEGVEYDVNSNDAIIIVCE